MLKTLLSVGLTNQSRPLKAVVTNSNSIARTCLRTMKHSGPSPGGKGHKSTEEEDARILVQLSESGPSPGIGH
ncbi:hypothetical protein E2542_SST07558 [Spatholobus suberectus]|nr:hypothetical protein E2542_SST07558 [Spatholobus suberectus]